MNHIPLFRILYIFVILFVGLDGVFAVPGNVLQEAKVKADDEAKSNIPTNLPASIERREGRLFCLVDGAEMVWVPPGNFLYGDKEQKLNPRQTVYLDGFFIDKYEVTNAQYRSFVSATGHPEPGYEERKRGKNRIVKIWEDLKFNQPKQPVIGVSWKDGSEYCHWAGKQLPTQAQWEKAARGTQGNKYPWGNEPPQSKVNENFRANFAQTFRPGHQQAGNDGSPYSALVGKFLLDKSPYGVLDMAGNVAEWCQDWWGAPQARVGKNPKGPSTGKAKVIKGGSWMDAIVFADPLQSSHVTYQIPARRVKNLGFRGVIVLRKID